MKHPAALNGPQFLCGSFLKRPLQVVEADNPGAPYQRRLRQYGFVGASFPGRSETDEGYALTPGKPLSLKFRLLAADVLY